jgi:hypothetical protein
MDDPRVVGALVSTHLRLALEHAHCGLRPARGQLAGNGQPYDPTADHREIASLGRGGEDGGLAKRDRATPRSPRVRQERWRRPR